MSKRKKRGATSPDQVIMPYALYCVLRGEDPDPSVDPGTPVIVEKSEEARLNELGEQMMLYQRDSAMRAIQAFGRECSPLYARMRKVRLKK